MLGKVVLWISTLAFVSYGLACLLSPELPANNAGLAMLNGDGYAEVGAMYGGLQTGFGLFCLLAALSPAYFRAGLTALVLVVGCLAVGRLYSTFTTDQAVAFYTWGAMGYEFATAILAAVALKLTPQSS